MSAFSTFHPADFFILLKFCSVVLQSAGIMVGFWNLRKLIALLTLVLALCINLLAVVSQYYNWFIYLCLVH